MSNPNIAASLFQEQSNRSLPAPPPDPSSFFLIPPCVQASARWYLDRRPSFLFDRVQHHSLGMLLDSPRTGGSILPAFRARSRYRGFRRVFSGAGLGLSKRSASDAAGLRHGLRSMPADLAAASAHAFQRAERWSPDARIGLRPRQLAQHRPSVAPIENYRIPIESRRRQAITPTRPREFSRRQHEAALDRRI